MKRRNVDARSEHPAWSPKQEGGICLLPRQNCQYHKRQCSVGQILGKMATAITRLVNMSTYQYGMGKSITERLAIGRSIHGGRLWWRDWQMVGAPPWKNQGGNFGETRGRDVGRHLFVFTRR